MQVSRFLILALRDMLTRKQELGTKAKLIEVCDEIAKL
jgi:hypothetical protein